MNPFKIKVTHELSNIEIQEALFELGCEWFGSTHEVKPLANCWIDVGSNGRLTWSFHGSDEKELTLPQLRDLVVLKRGDASDANVYEDTECSCLYNLYLTANRELYFYHCGKEKWIISSLNHDEDYYATLKPIEKSQPQDPALISGAEAHKALLAGENVQYSGYGEQYWDTALNCNIGVFLNHEKFPDFKFRIVPRTIKLELEIPAPYKAKIGGRDDTSFVLNVGRHQYLYQNEDDYKKARDALEAVFDSAVRGTNS
ncbi:TPA: hypothetical protein OMQ72_003214 [Acinetobacter baumannii]|nr:hypothetical protein [Acinetobacter baumannii]